MHAFILLLFFGEDSLSLLFYVFSSLYKPFFYLLTKIALAPWFDAYIFSRNGA